MMNKKGIFGFIYVFFFAMLLGLIFLFLLWLLAPKIAESLQPIFDFFENYKWWFLASTLLFIFKEQAIAIANWLLAVLRIR